MAIREAFAPDEWYHCFSRGIDKRNTFKTRFDYDRFLQLLYLCNSSKVIHRSDFRSLTTPEVLCIPRPSTLVAIGAFCLMPNHFHLLIKEPTGNGISAFMQKLGTAYAMYFNIKYERNGNLFVKPFRSRHIGDDRYLQQVIQYIHCNPSEIFEPQWKEGHAKNIQLLEKKLLAYPFSSFQSFTDEESTVRKILDKSIFEVESQFKPHRMLKEAREYYEYVKATP